MFYGSLDVAEDSLDKESVVQRNFPTTPVMAVIACWYLMYPQCFDLTQQLAAQADVKKQQQIVLGKCQL